MRALVLGGGGVAGIAWEIGILHGLGEAVLDVDVIVGTSAGSVVAAAVNQIPVAEAYERQTTPSPPRADAAGPVPAIGKLMQLFAEIAALPEPEQLRRVADAALSAQTMPEDVFRKLIGTSLPSPDWPRRRVAVVAYDTATCERTVFTKDSGVDLLSAVAASCSVPGVFPPVTIDGKRYMDGGSARSTNSDLVAGYDEVLVISPMAGVNPVATARVITPDRASLVAMMPNVLDPASRGPSAEAGYRQGKALRL
ncbi:patatin-like phospholipase family protein [Kibdelosporangium phytohabitans]|uniref:PNPLA domain-containing protein n=1 Tax=Kibdelosporangium phytohabitans TaxID=860235 RepID=A0A0N9HS80_9PSEU|nr:patatin-like phospholipase family protein [Kibdelosporangium phytohabitans]ALG06006.1 hypothetical protein AOZ06_02900 [Kibdelosporangium phytohabitans]MBE1465926.1 NTE family protein [Kibdelosporangium phytohabitans]